MKNLEVSTICNKIILIFASKKKPEVIFPVAIVFKVVLCCHFPLRPAWEVKEN